MRDVLLVAWPLGAAAGYWLGYRRGHRRGVMKGKRQQFLASSLAARMRRPAA